MTDGRGPDEAARACLLEAFEAGRGAELTSTMTSVEGDPIARITRVHEDGTVEVFHDATRDRFGSGRWERLACDRLVPIDELVHEMDASWVFIEDGCEEIPAP